VVAIVSSLLYSCGAIPGFKGGPSLGPSLHLNVSIFDNVNQNHPIEVDVVMVYDKDLVEELSEMPAAEWFQRRFQIENEDLSGEKVEFSSWEWAPGQLIGPVNLQFSRKGRAVIIFANFLAEGEHRVRIDKHDRLRLFLGEEGLEIEPL